MTGINLSDKFTIEYDKDIQTISIIENKKYFNIYPKNIVNVNAFLGKNGVGKSNILDLIGMRINDRNNLKEERNVIYKTNKSERKFKALKFPRDIEQIQKNSQYFMVYYIGRNESGLNEFCFEGNDIESFQNIIENHEKVDTHYFDSKYWFSLICTYNNRNMFVYQKNILDRGYGERKSIQDKVAIILFRETYNEKYFNYFSKKSDDESKIAAPRRIANFKADSVYKQLEFLVNQLKNENRHLYNKESYLLRIYFDTTDYERDAGINLTNFLYVKKYHEQLDKVQRAICNFSHSFTLHFLNNAGENLLFQAGIKLELEILRDNVYEQLKHYYFDLLVKLMEKHLMDGVHVEKFIKKYNETIQFFEDVFLSSKLDFKSEAIFKENELTIRLTKYTDSNILNQLLKMTIDEPFLNEMENEEFLIYNNFFYYDLEHLSDGERAYLGLMSSIDEQISLKTQVISSVNKKENFILLIDEPETKLHPELARIFLKSLIDFLQQYKDKIFQIILTSHSPYLISDIPRENIVTIKREDSMSKVKGMDVSTFAQNIHTLSKEAFFMEATMGAYSIYKVQQINSLLDSNEQLTEQQLDEIEYVINMIGEQVLKTVLQDKLRTKRAYQSGELEAVIKLYNALSINEKEDLIKYIISTQEGE